MVEHYPSHHFYFHKEEEWRDVLDYEGFYSVSSYGRVRRDAGGFGTFAGRILKPQPDRDGYLLVSLSRAGNERTVKVHALVARAFIGPCPPGHNINHQNTVKSDNHVDNLRYTTPLQNTAHAFEHGLMPWPRRPKREKCEPVRGERQGSARLTDDIVRAIRESYSAGIANQYELARMYGVAAMTVNRVVNRKTWAHVK